MNDRRLLAARLAVMAAAVACGPGLLTACAQLPQGGSVAASVPRQPVAPVRESGYRLVKN